MLKGFKTHWYQTLILSIPLILGQLGQVFMMVADSVMVGQLGATQLAVFRLGILEHRMSTQLLNKYSISCEENGLLKNARKKDCL